MILEDFDDSDSTGRPVWSRRTIAPPMPVRHSVTPRVRPASSDQTACRRLNHCCLTRRRDHEFRTSQEDPEFVEIPLILSSYRPQIPSPV